MASTPTTSYFSAATGSSSLPDIPDFSLPGSSSSSARQLKSSSSPPLPTTRSTRCSNSRNLFLSLFLASYVIFGMTIFSFTWILFYSFNPSFVKVTHQSDIFPRPGADPDPVKCFIYAFLLSIFCVVIFWLLTRCI